MSLGVISEFGIAIFVISLIEGGRGGRRLHKVIFIAWRLRVDAVGCPQMPCHRDARSTHVIHV